MPPTARETRENFEAGKVDGWTAGEYGHTARVFAARGKLKIRHQDPSSRRQRQRTLFAADSRELRKKAAAVAVALSERLRAGAAVQAEAQAEPARAATLTTRELCLLYMQRVPRFEERLLGSTKHEIEAWYDQLPASVRESANLPAFATIWSDVYAFRRLWQHDSLAPGRRLLDLEPADANQYFNDYVGGGGSPRTAVADLDKLSCAIRYVIVNHRRTVGLLYNPIEGRKVDRTKADVPAYTTEEVRRLREAAPALAATGEWQVLVAGGIAASGRRLGTILGLSASDHDLEAGTVRFRAEFAKGKNYGRGDDVRPMTAVHRRAVEWAINHHPNPLGADAPLLWRTRDPSRAVPQPTVWAQLQRLETRAKVPHLAGRAWHSFRRMMATILADEIGDGPASEFIGMTTETLRKYRYKKIQSDTMVQAAGAADRLLEEG
jgi:hypothetical protein